MDLTVGHFRVARNPDQDVALYRLQTLTDLEQSTCTTFGGSRFLCDLCERIFQHGDNLPAGSAEACNFGHAAPYYIDVTCVEDGDNMPDEISAKELRVALAEAIGDDPNSSAVEGLMRALDDKKLFRYHKDEGINLLSTAGRVLMAIMQDPTLTQRAISVYLGCSETLVDKTVKSLDDCGLITKTKVNRKNVYRINPVMIDGHSDIQHLRDAIDLLNTLMSTKKTVSKPAEETVRPQKMVSPRQRVVDSEPF